MYDILRPGDNLDETEVRKICNRYKEPAMVFINASGGARFLAIDTEPMVAWGEHVKKRIVIGTYKPTALFKIVLTYARML